MYRDTKKGRKNPAPAVYYCAVAVGVVCREPLNVVVSFGVVVATIKKGGHNLQPPLSSQHCSCELTFCLYI